MRLAYQELQIDRKKEDKKLQTLEGKKREQAERLGMGLASRRLVHRTLHCYTSVWTLVIQNKAPGLDYWGLINTIFKTSGCSQRMETVSIA